MTKTKKSTTVQEFCRKHRLTEDQFFGREEVGGSLYLRSLTSIPEASVVGGER